MPHNWKGRRRNKKGKKVAPCQGPYTPNGVSRQHPEFPKKPHNFPQQKYDTLFQKYCRIKEIKGRYRPGIIDEKRVARRDKRLNAIIEKVTMPNSICWPIASVSTKESNKPKSVPFAVKKEETGLNEVLKFGIKSEAMSFDVKKEKNELQNDLSEALKLEIKPETLPFDVKIEETEDQNGLNVALKLEIKQELPN